VAVGSIIAANTAIVIAITINLFIIITSYWIFPIFVLYTTTFDTLVTHHLPFRLALAVFWTNLSLLARNI
jgi:hypothetical protein